MRRLQLLDPGGDMVSSISLFDGSPITEFDVLPASASGLLYSVWEAEAGSRAARRLCWSDLRC
jgi:hypothetical protein